MRFVLVKVKEKGNARRGFLCIFSGSIPSWPPACAVGGTPLLSGNVMMSATDKTLPPWPNRGYGLLVGRTSTQTLASPRPWPGRSRRSHC